MKPTRIIIHHSLTEDSKTLSWQAIRRYHKETNGWKDIGYHYGIELVNDEYEILTGRMLNVPGAHTVGQNHDSIGVCVVGNFDNKIPPKDQWNMAVKLCKALCNLLNIPVSQIFAHRDFAKKSCPGKMFDMDKFRHDVFNEV
jgi:hypothetical protein